MTDRPRYLTIHQSDSACLARFRAERILGLDAANEAAKIGTACHKACEALASLEGDEEIDRTTQLAVARDEINSASIDLGLSATGTLEAHRIMESALSPTSHLRFGRPTGWESSAELRWALDRNFNACDPDDPKRVASGMIDLAEWQESSGKVRITDEKTTLSFQKGDDVSQSWQARLYSLWAIQNWGVQSVVFRYRNLRHGYAVSDEMHKSMPWFEATKARVLILRAEREAAVEMDTWPETLGDDCGWCPVRHKCGAMLAAAAQGREIDPAISATEIGKRRLALAVLAADYDRRARAIVDGSGKPIDLGGGMALGLRPLSGYRLAPRFSNNDGSVTDEQYARLMEFLRGYKMTAEQEREWFRNKSPGDLPGAVKSALYDLLGKHATALINDASASPLDGYVKYEFRAWLPTTGKRVPEKTLDELIDNVSW